MEQIESNGLVVPWVVRWTSEVCADSIKVMRDPVTNQVSLEYPDERPEDRIDGVLWLRSHDSRGVGEPEWTAVHSGRQRACMLDRRCQVCGEAIPGKVVPWLLPQLGADRRTKNGITTMTPPTCRDCIPLAMATCPHLNNSKNRVDLYEVRQYRPWAYFGDVVDDLGHILGEVPYKFSETSHLAARQIIVELSDFRKVRLP